MDNISNINDNYIGGDFLDGQWCDYSATLYESTLPASTTGVQRLDLSEILPADNYNYLCQIYCWTQTTASSGVTVYPEFHSGTQSLKSTGDSAGIAGLLMGGTRARSNARRAGGSWCYLPVYSQDRAITVWSRSTTAGTDVHVYLRRIRRMGTNK